MPRIPQPLAAGTDVAAPSFRQWLNDLLALALSGRTTVAMGCGLTADVGPGGTTIGLSRAMPVVRFAFTPGGGIAAMSGTTPGSASCTMYDFNGTALVAAETATVYNAMTSGAVAASKYVVVAAVGDPRDKRWFVLAEPC